MPLSEAGRKILKNMIKEYGAKKGKEVFYASENKGILTSKAFLGRGLKRKKK